MATPRPQPVELHSHAMDNLRYIRQTMERAGSFTAVPGKGGILMGLAALAAAGLRSGKQGNIRWLALWVGTAALAMAVGIAGVAARQARSVRGLAARGRRSSGTVAVFCARRRWADAGVDP